MNKTVTENDITFPQRIDRRIAELGGWRGSMLARIRRLILNAAPDLTGEWKWDTPVWTYNGNVVAFGAFQDHIKLNFFKGAALKDPGHLFNAGLEARATRAIDIFEGDEINEDALQDLIRAAAALNATKSRPAKTSSKQPQQKKTTKTKK
jgi:hypothetical protein